MNFFLYSILPIRRTKTTPAQGLFRIQTRPTVGLSIGLKPPDVLDLRAFYIGVAGSPTVIANNKRIQIAIVKNGLDVAGLHARTQVLNHLVRVEHVAADLVAKTNRGLGSANLVQGLGTLLELNLVQASLEDLHARGLVLDLAALVLAGDHNAAGEMRHAHGGVGGVNALTARAARVVHVHADVIGTDFDVDIIG